MGKPRMRRWIMGMIVINPFDESGTGALGDWRCGVLGKAPGNISNEFPRQRQILNLGHSLNLFLA